MSFAWIAEVALLASACTRLAPFFPYRPGPWRAGAPGRRMDAETRARAENMLAAGAGINETRRATGISQSMVAAMRRDLERAGHAAATCGCGRPVTHQGRCVARRVREKAERGQAA